MYEKLKFVLCDDSIYVAALLLFVGVISFGLGRQSVIQIDSEPQSAGIVFMENVQTSNSEPETFMDTKVEVVTSKSGTKYHLLDCPGASQIKDENKVYFTSTETAKAAGYTAAANCPGL
jgi:hypothetical protein